MYLIKTELEGTNFTTKFVTGQPNTESAGVDINTHSFRVADTKILTRYPVGTYFIVGEIIWGDVASTIPGNIRPVCFETTVYTKTTDPANTASNADVNYFIDYLVETNHNVEDIKKMANDFVAAGYTIDVEEKIKARKADTSGTLKDRIKRLYPCPSNEEIGFHIEEDIWYLLIRNILKGENTLLVGPTGSGKTELVTHIAKALSKPLNIQDMGTIQDAQSALLGVHRLNKEGHSAFDYAPFVSHVQQEGIVLLDELNRSPLAANNILFPCLDKRRYLPIDIACDDCERKIEVNKDCVFFATANLGAEYSGTTMIDRALLDRFFVVELSYPTEKAEAAILVNKTGVNEKTAKAIVKVSKQIRDQYKSQELSNVVSVRHTLLVASLIQDGFDTVGALEKVIMPLFDEADGISERSKVKSIIAAN